MTTASPLRRERSLARRRRSKGSARPGVRGRSTRGQAVAGAQSRAADAGHYLSIARDDGLHQVTSRRWPSLTSAETGRAAMNDLVGAAHTLTILDDTSNEGLGRPLRSLRQEPGPAWSGEQPAVEQPPTGSRHTELFKSSTANQGRVGAAIPKGHGGTRAGRLGVRVSRVGVFEPAGGGRRRHQAGDATHVKTPCE